MPTNHEAGVAAVDASLDAIMSKASKKVGGVKASAKSKSQAKRVKVQTASKKPKAKEKAAVTEKVKRPDSSVSTYTHALAVMGEDIMKLDSKKPVAASDLETALNSASRKVQNRIKAIANAVQKGSIEKNTTAIAIDLLKKGSATRGQLIEHYIDGKANKVKAYTKGTASAQANSVVGALSLLRVIEVNGNDLSLNENSTILQKLG